MCLCDSITTYEQVGVQAGSHLTRCVVLVPLLRTVASGHCSFTTKSEESVQEYNFS